jgi:uncharacterized RmlC-like cupin family protein
MMRHRLVFGLFLLALAAPALAEDVAPPAQPDNAAMAAQSATPASQHVLFTVLNGNPGAPGLFTIRAMLPAGYKVPAHFHGTDENVTVIAGEMSIGMGDVLDMAKGDALGAGGFTAMSAGMHHYAWTKKGATIQIHGMGPFSITYLNPSDDPRNAKEAAK